MSLFSNFKNKLDNEIGYYKQKHEDRDSNLYINMEQKKFRENNPVGAREQYQAEHPTQNNTDIDTTPNRDQHNNVQQPTDTGSSNYQPYKPVVPTSYSYPHKKHPFMRGCTHIVKYLAVGAVVVIALLICYGGSQKLSNNNSNDNAQAQPTQTKETKIIKQVPYRVQNPFPSNSNNNGSNDSNSSDQPENIALDNQGRELAREMQQIDIDQHNMDKLLYAFQLQSPEKQSQYYNEAQDKLQTYKYLPTPVKRAMVNHIANTLNSSNVF